MLTRIKSLFIFRDFMRILNTIPSEVQSTLLISVVFGFFAFTIELLFIVCFQVFLVSLGFTGASQFKFTKWIDPKYGIVILMAYGLAKAVIVFVKSYQSGKSYQLFSNISRSKITRYLFSHNFNTDANRMFDFFNEKTVKAGYVVKHLTIMTQSMITLFFLLAFSMYVAPKEFFVAWPVTLILPTLVIYFNRQITELGKKISTQSEEVTKQFTQGIRNHFLLSVYGQMSKYRDVTLEHADKYYGLYRNFYKISSLKSSVLVFIALQILILTAWLSRNYFGTPIELLVAFLYFYLRSTQTLVDIGGSASNIRLNQNSLFSLTNFLNQLDRLSEEKERLPLMTDIETIEMENVGFAYPLGQQILCGLNLKMRKGDIVTFHGPSGSGKSTLIALLLGLLKPTTGRVLINGLSLEDNRIDAKNLVGYISSEPFLVPDTVRANLHYPDICQSDQNDMHLWQVLDHVGMKDTISQMSRCLDEKLDEKVQLSTGQKQRIAAARVLLKKPQIVVLDEATSNLDSASEEKVLQSILSSRTTQITILVSHRALKLGEQRTDVALPHLEYNSISNENI